MLKGNKNQLSKSPQLKVNKGSLMDNNDNKKGKKYVDQNLQST
jgi:hypothetical protein